MTTVRNQKRTTTVKERHWTSVVLWAVSTVGLATGTASRAADSPEHALVRQILAAAGGRGGLVVHLGCGGPQAGRLTAALRVGGGLVQGLDADARHVQAARDYIRSLGLYGDVSVQRFAGRRLPYVDNLVNLLVISGPSPVAREEIMRVLCPGGTAVTITADGEPRIAGSFVKPRPAELDDWTHYLYDASGNAVSHDTLVAPPRHLQWVGNPAWTRHHDHMSSFTAMVSAGGRVFYIVDEGLRAEIQLPSQWLLIARDAFNGTILWKRPLDDWQPQLWPAKSGPAQLPRRLVASGDTVYVTLGLNAPITALDAASGRTRREYEATRGTEEILYSNGVLFALVNPDSTLRPWTTRAGYATFDELRSEVDSWAWDASPRAVVAVQADTGQRLWQTPSPVAPLTLAVDDSRVFFHNGQQVVCLDRQTGGQRWTSAPLARAAEIRSWFAPTLVVAQDVVVFAGGEKMVRHFGGKDTMTALAAGTGELLWTAEHPASGYDSPEDVLIAGGLVWTAPLTNRRDSGEFTGRDLRTGVVRRTFPCDCGDHMPHHRCHRAKATDRFILASRTGIEYVDLGAEHWNRHDWVRGACLYGIMPANGLTYAPPQSCACYILAKLNGLNSLAPERSSTPRRVDESPSSEAEASRLERGPAYDWAGAPPSALDAPLATDWPTYRHDAARSGHTAAAVPHELRLAWQTDVGGKLSSPVVAAGRVFVAAVDRHAVQALDQRTGAPQWQFTAGGRVDSPPTVWQGRVLFGSSDGCVYCLRAGDGALAWRYRAAPADEQLVAFEQLESVWPVHGSVLVHAGVVHCVAGRSMFLDGGMRYLRLDAATGSPVSETTLDNRHPVSGQPLDAEVRWPNLPVALPDILSCDGKHVYLRSQVFDLQGQRTEVVAPTDYQDQTGETAHLFCNTGFLDDSWWHRSLWLYGKTAVSGAGGWYTAAYRAPTGRIMVFDDQRVYSFDRQPQYYPRTTALEYHVYSAPKAPQILGGNSAPQAKPQANRPTPSRPIYDWSCQTTVIGRALVLAGKTLFLAGPPRVVDEEQTLLRLDAPETREQLTAQGEAFAGRQGARLLALSATAGERLAAYELESLPVFDGLAAADGCLYLAATDGRVLCLGSSGPALAEAADVTVKASDLTANARAGFAATASHPDFAHLAQVRLAACDLGWRLTAAAGQVGYALRELPVPLTKQAGFKFRLHLVPKDKSADPPRNGFFVFGAAADEASLVKCGMRRKQGLILQGPYTAGKSAGQTLAAARVDETCEILVAVDLDTQQVRMTVHGETIQAKLDRPLEAIKYIGYCANSVTAEFSGIEISGGARPAVAPGP